MHLKSTDNRIRYYYMERQMQTENTNDETPYELLLLKTQGVCLSLVEQRHKVLSSNIISYT